MTKTPEVAACRRGRALVLTIQRPEAKNAINRQVAERIRDEVRAAEQQGDLSAIVLSACPCGVFVAGGDLKEFRKLPFDPTGAQHILDLGAELRCIEDSPLPVIAAVDGDVLGGGCELVVLCDLVVMEQPAGLEFRHVRMGLTPAWGGSSRLAERVGSVRAADLLLTGRRVEAPEALAMGLINRVVPPGRALATALELAEQIADHGTASVGAIKASLTAARRAGRADALAREQAVFRSAWGSPSHRAAMDAFGGKG